MQFPQLENLEGDRVRKATESRKEPGEVITVDKKRPRVCKRAEKLTFAEGGGFGSPTELFFNLVPATQEPISFAVNGALVNLDASDTVKMMVQNAWSTTSKLLVCVCYNDSGIVEKLCLVPMESF